MRKQLKIIDARLAQMMYKHLRTMGKERKVAIVACMRKMITTLNALKACEAKGMIPRAYA